MYLPPGFLSFIAGKGTRRRAGPGSYAAAAADSSSAQSSRAASTNAGVAKAALDLLRADAGPEADERQLADVAQRRRRRPLGERRPRLDEEHVRVADKQVGLDRLEREWQGDEGEIEAPVLDPLEEDVVLGLSQAHLDLRPRDREAAQELGEDARPHALEGADPERAGLAGRQRRHIGPGGAKAGDDRLGVADEGAPGLGQAARPGPAATLDQLLSDRALERRDLLAHGRLGIAERLRGAAERAVLRDRLKRRQMAEFNPEPAIRFHDRNEQYLDLCLWASLPIIWVWERSW